MEDDSSSSSSSDTESIDTDMEDEEVLLPHQIPLPPRQPHVVLPRLPSTASTYSAVTTNEDTVDVPSVAAECTVTTTSDADTVTEHLDDGPKYDWSKMPDIVVIQLLSFLDDEDRNSIARTCRRWSQLFHDPSLWRERYFQFGGGRSSRREAQRVMGFARTHGSHLQHLRIYCLHPAFCTCKRFLRTMEEFFSTLNRTRYGQCLLREFHIPQLQVSTMHADFGSRSRYLRQG